MANHISGMVLCQRSGRWLLVNGRWSMGPGSGRRFGGVDHKSLVESMIAR